VVENETRADTPLESTMETKAQDLKCFIISRAGSQEWNRFL